ncbi:MAG TPA: choice-of-anchor L domain-containing protein [bacterium]|nr:choice-of-anchor L domain-containing protein [bacterium]
MSRYPFFLLCAVTFLISCDGTEKIPLKDADVSADTDIDADGATEGQLPESDTPLPNDKDIDDDADDEVADETDEDLTDVASDADDATGDDLPIDDDDIDDTPTDDDNNDESADEDIIGDGDGPIGPDQDTDTSDDTIDDTVTDTDTEVDIAPDIDADTDAHICDPETTVECPYSGPPATKNVGECKAGTKTCDLDGKGWSECTGEVVPIAEICDNGKNDDCDGGTDEHVDEDGDGWFSCVDDCCDSVLACTYPKKVNPGAIEVPEDGIDNDCNGETDEDPRTACSSAAKFSGTTALDLVKAIDICKTSTGGSWGIVGTPTITRASGSGTIDASNRQVAVMNWFGTHGSNEAIYGSTMAALSSGRARDANDPDPTTEDTYEYYDGTPPADFTAPYAGNLPKTDPDCPAGTGANDGVMLTVDLKVPTNAYGFSFLFRFFSQEYWQFTCNAYNDFFIAMLDTGAAGIPLDKNISFDSNGSYISVNSNAFFTVCTEKTGYTCPDGTAPLAGTGWDQPGYDEELGDIYTGGATKWLATAAPVIPGETIKLRFVVWDTSDRKLDSLVLVDNFKWNTEGSDPVDTDPGNDTDILPDSDSQSDTDIDAGPDADSTGPSTYECWDLNQNGTCDAADEDRSGDGFCTERDCG